VLGLGANAFAGVLFRPVASPLCVAVGSGGAAGVRWRVGQGERLSGWAGGDWFHSLHPLLLFVLGCQRRGGGALLPLLLASFLPRLFLYFLLIFSHRSFLLIMHTQFSCDFSRSWFHVVLCSVTRRWTSIDGMTWFHLLGSGNL
jgi:hypothetical protein